MSRSGLVQLEIAITQDDQVTTAAVITASDAEETFVGSAKRHPGDVHNPDIGLNLALARLYRQMADGIEAQVNDQIDAATRKASIAVEKPSRKSDRMMEIFTEEGRNE